MRMDVVEGDVAMVVLRISLTRVASRRSLKGEKLVVAW